MASLTDDNEADGNLDKWNIWLIGVGHTSTPYIATYRSISFSCAFKFPLFLYISNIAGTAMQLQSAGKALQINPKISIFFTQFFIGKALSCIHRTKTAVKSGYITLV